MRGEGSNGCVPGQESCWLYHVCLPLGTEARMSREWLLCHVVLALETLSLPYTSAPKDSLQVFLFKS